MFKNFRLGEVFFAATSSAVIYKNLLKIASLLSIKVFSLNTQCRNLVYCSITYRTPERVRVSIFVVSAILSFGLFSITLPVLANDTKDVNEASVFFEEVLSHTENPLIAAFAKESLQKLKNESIEKMAASVSSTTTSGKETKIATAITGKKRIETQFANFTSNVVSKPVVSKKQPVVDPDTVEVPLIKGTYASNVVVPARLNRDIMGTFIVDTGATYTVITPAMAKQLGVNINKNTQRIAILTANGWIQAPIVTLDSLSLGNVEVGGLQAVVQDLGGDANLSGLLGMNFFKDIELTIRRDKLLLRISSAY